MRKPKSLKFKPYARLLTMLGDQLIKNERVALVELIKNAYDADASWVKVTFEGFNKDFQPTAASRIIIEDDGRGMDRDIIENHWVNPATPTKLIRKKTQNRPKTRKGRVIQGEKGIGRFALLKIGRTVAMTTRASRSTSELLLRLDLSSYDQDFIKDGKGIFLDDVTMTLAEIDPATTIRRQKIRLGAAEVSRAPHGTRIEISGIEGSWSRSKVEKVYEDLARLQSVLPESMEAALPDGEGERSTDDPFEVYIYRGDELEPFGQERREQLSELLRERPVFKIAGRYDEAAKQFDFSINGKHQKLSLLDPKLTGLKIYRDHYFDRSTKTNELASRKTQCGPFGFTFYVFDFEHDAAPAHLLDKADRELIREHRIYLYRDGIRVYPYGDPDDDWLQIDVLRGTIKASAFLSNDQVVGVVDITQAENPQLRDKTSREGLVDVGDATSDFQVLLQMFLGWVRQGPFAEIQLKKKQAKDVDVFKGDEVERSFEGVSKALEEGNAKQAQEELRRAQAQYKAERRYLTQRAENTEHLAGVGLSVEAASHDLMLGMSSVLRALDALMAQTGRGRPIDPTVLHQELASIRGLLSFVEAHMKDMQVLFRSTKQRRQTVRVKEVLEKVYGIYRSLLDKHGIEFEVNTMGSPLQALTTDAVLLQVFLNLFDNAAYWLEGRAAPRKIEVLLDGDKQQLIFADNGPGFQPEDLPYLFEAFFSGKGEEGRGLGLYIARQLLARQGYSISVSDRRDAISKGANLTISFVQEKEQ